MIQQKCTNRPLNDVFGLIGAFFKDFQLIEAIIAERCFFVREHCLKHLVILLTSKTN